VTRLPLSRRKAFLVAGLLVALLAVVLAFGPLVRRRIVEEAARRHLDIEVGAVRPGWFAVRLLDVGVRPVGLDEARVRVTEVRVRLTLGLRVEGVELHGGDVSLHGDLDRLREKLRAWREGLPRGNATSPGAIVPIAADSLAVRWFQDGDPSPQIEILGLGFNRDDQGLRLAAARARLRMARTTFELNDGSVELDPTGSLLRAHAAAATVEWRPTPSTQDPSSTSSPGTDAAPDAPPGTPPAVVAVRATPPRRPTPAPSPKTPDPSSPLATLPDLHRLRGEADVLVSRLAEHVPVGAEATVDAMTWKIAPQDADQRVAFTIGPGPLSLTRAAARFEVRFSSDTRGAATTSLSVRMLLPTDGGDLSATLEGGPVSLSLLGVHDGAAGLVDVSRATVTGTAHLTFAGDRSAVTFDAELGTRGLSLSQPRLASDVVRGIDLDVRARGAMTDTGEVRLDDFAATLGALHMAGSGTFEQKPDHVGASFRFELPSAACQSLLDSVPTALLPVLQGTRMTGTFGARGRFAFDTRALDDLELDYDIQDQCRIVEVPVTLARQRFKQPFAHRIYRPDGTTADQTTGPGTPTWTSLGQISPYMQVAVLTTEDGGFQHHRGFNRPSIRSSIVANLKARRFVRGASTITMQLAKNLFLSRDKTLARKLEEVVLTEYLEQTFSKDELMELYLNVIEFGPAVYGVTNASEYYFGRSPGELTLAESLFLSSLLPSPIRYGAMRDLPQLPEGWTHMLHTMMQMEEKRGLITDAELAEGQSESIVFWHGGQRPPPRPAVLRSRLPGESDDNDPAPALPADPDGF
jgi:hypothetical protein